MQKHPQLPQAFADLGIEVRFLRAIQKLGFVQPSDIQTEMIPPALEGKDILGQAQTGTGKTAAFGLPILQQMDPAHRLQAICLAPTRELAVQVAAELRNLSEFAGLQARPMDGRQSRGAQVHAMGKKEPFVVGTPGRVRDMMRGRAMDISDVRFAVLDEVDRMLDIGFRDDIRDILTRIRGEHQTIFVSATIDEEINRLARRYMRDPLELNVSRDRLTVDEVDQSYVSVEPYDKFHVLRLILTQEDPPISIVFCNTKAMARKLAKKLHDCGIPSNEIHGDLIQAKRDRVMGRFRKHQIRVLVATDLAARGIDVSAISHIINYDVPKDPEIYVHRIGRTARMGAKGTAISFISSEEGNELTNIEMLINREVPQRMIPGFVPRPPREMSPQKVAPAPVSRFEKSVHRSNGDAPLSATAPRKTLGSRFRPARRRRL